MKTNDSTHADLQNFRSFVSRNFRNNQKSVIFTKFYVLIRTNQEDYFAQLKLTNSYLSEITVDNLNLKPVIDLFFNFLSKYQVMMEFMLNDTLKFPDLIQSLPPKCFARNQSHRFLERLFSGFIFSVNEKLIRPKDGCPIRGIFPWLWLEFVWPNASTKLQHSKTQKMAFLMP